MSSKIPSRKASVCMATFNGEAFVVEQIRSILSQINATDELIISDDSSTDNTVDLIKQIGDLRIKLLENNKFRDPIKNFENALTHATGDVIFLADQDDIWLDCKYSDSIALLIDYDLIVSDSIVTDENLNVLRTSFFELRKSGKGICKNIIQTTYYGSCMAFNRQILRYALPFPNTKEIGHDLWIGLVAELVGRVYFYPKPLILYRRHGGAVTQAAIGTSKRKTGEKIIGRYVITVNFLKFTINYFLNGKRASLHNYTCI